jgi:ELWxxDGT repeat protein
MGRTRVLLMVLMLGSVCLAAPAAAQWPRLLANINNTNEGSEPYLPVEANGLLFFAADDGIHGRELWATDGTVAGTRMVADIDPGAPGSGPADLVAMGSIIYFTVVLDDGNDFTSELLRSDGTEAGTYSIYNFGDSYPRLRVRAVAGDILFFVGIDGTQYELFKTDGTPEGTGLVKDINPSGSSMFSTDSMAALGDEVFFYASDGVSDAHLWKSDGTEQGTVLVSDATTSYEDEMLAVGQEIYFGGEVEGAWGDRLWKTDGTEEGTVLVSDEVTPHDLFDFNGSLVFRADHEGDLQLFISDGTAEGTVPFTDLEISLRDRVAVLGDRIFFPADDGLRGVELWSSDGTLGGTRMLDDLVPGVDSANPDYLLTVGSELYFQADEGLWKTNGKRPGTVRLGDFRHESPRGQAYTDPTGPASLGSVLLFPAADDTHGAELWKSDGSVAGTSLLADLATTDADGLSLQWTQVGDRVYLAGNYSYPGSELWVTDASPAGTRRVGQQQIEDMTGFGPGSGRSAVALGDTLFFNGYSPNHGFELWKHVPGQAPVMVKDIAPGPESCGSWAYTYSAYEGPAELTAAGDLVFFFADDGVHGHELWRSDGTPEGTVMVKDLNQGDVWDSAVDFHFAMAALGDEVLLTAYDGAVAGLWKSDGTEAGTELVKDVNIVNAASMTVAGDLLFFFVDEPGSDPYGEEVWRSDGTPEGTVLVKDIRTGSIGSAPSHLTAVGDLLFFTANTVADGHELWRSDGSEAGTVMVKNIWPGPEPDYYSAPESLEAMEGVLFFAANDGVHGAELWRSDGTEEGTFLVRDIAPDPEAEGPSDLRNAGGWLLFAADDGVSGRELWLSDGSEAGTLLLADLEPGPDDSEPDRFSAVGDGVVFTADVEPWGRELWALSGWEVTHALDVRLEGEGAGVVRSDPAGIDCGLDCVEVFAHGTEVELVADPASGSYFVGWSGHPDCADGGLGLTGLRGCVATFEECQVAPHVHLENLTIDESQTITACNWIHVGPSFVLGSGVDLVLRAGEGITFYSVAQVEGGATLTTEIAPPEEP